MAVKIHFGFGLGKTKHGHIIDDVEPRLDEIKREAAQRFGGYSLTRIEGGWINTKGELVEEPGAILEVVLPHESVEGALALSAVFRDTIKRVLIQEAIVLTVQIMRVAEFE